MNKVLLALVVILFIGCVCGLYAVKKYKASQRQVAQLNRELARSAESAEQLTELLGSGCATKMVFLHHSVGRNILYAGGLQRLLLQQGIFVSGATYGDEIGQHTDIPDWGPKFRDQMDKVLTFKSHPDHYFTDGTRNDMVMFKSCYPNSNIADGDTLERFRGSFTVLKDQMMKQEETLFIYLTAPPLVPPRTTPENAAQARQFNDWLINEFLVEYRDQAPVDNFAVFDLFGFLAGPDNTLKQAYRRERPTDSHPTDEASRQAAEAFVRFLEPLWGSWQNRESGAV